MSHFFYARQLPDKDCPLAERYTRSFNYPEESCLKTKADLKRLGIKTFFASNVCCAYDREKFWFQGGFIKNAIFNEDMIFAGKAVMEDDYAIAYVADAKVIHSHNYNCTQQFKRNFDLAVSQADHPEVFGGIRSESEGIRLVKQTAHYLSEQHKPWLIPGMFVKSGFKYMGYRMGKAYHMLPQWLVMKCTMNRHLVFGLILLGISAYYLNDQLSALCGTDMQAFMLPAILILIGIVTVFSHGGRSRNHGYGRTPEEFKTMNYTSADGFLHSENAFSGVRQVILDEMLKGGSIQTRFGGSIIDMRRTDIPVGETPLDVDCKFGGIELYVPADWTIKCLCSTFMGGYEDKRWEREENPQKVLVIRGTLSWSGLVVKN